MSILNIIFYPTIAKPISPVPIREELAPLGRNCYDI